MRVYDFDKTIYNGDSTVHFYGFCVRKNPLLLLRFPLITGLRFRLGLERKVIFKERFYRFLQGISDVDSLLEEFWDLHICNIKSWYKPEPSDVIISASPEFLLEPACRRIGIQHLMASVVDKHTGRYTGENCWGEEKVRRFREKYDGDIDEFYSDSLSDTPLARLARKSFMVNGDEIVPWGSHERK